MDYVIGVDIGTQSTKALLVEAGGRVIAQHSQSYSVETPRPLWAQQDPRVWLDAVAHCIRACAAQEQVDAEDIRGICVSGLYGGSGIPVDAAMLPLHPCLIWMDRRAQAEADWAASTVGIERLRAITGNGADSYYGFTKILWIRNHLPEVWSNTHLFLPPNVYVNHVLTGEVAIDHSSAGNLGGVYDIAQRRWSGELLDTLGIPQRMMPARLVDSSDVVGHLTAEWATRLGLLPDTVVVAGGVDAAVATLAAGAAAPGQHVAMIGTSMCWGYISQTVDADRGLVTMPYVFNAAKDVYCFGGAITAGASVTWFREQCCGAAAAAGAPTAGLPTAAPPAAGPPAAGPPIGNSEAAYAVLERSAAQVAAGADGVLFLPYLMGERSPIWDARANGAFVGLNLFHTNAHLYRSVLEGVAYSLKHNMIAVRHETSLDPRLIVVGGAHNSNVWMQIIADVTGYPVFTIRENVEAALGAAMLAAYGTGLVTEAQVHEGWVTLEERARPDAATHADYQLLFTMYRALYPALKTVMHGLSDFAQAQAGATSSRNSS